MSLEEKGIAFELRTISAVEAKQDPHLNRHRFGRVRAFEHGDLRLYETQAILRYLEDVFAEPGRSASPPDWRDD